MYVCHQVVEGPGMTSKDEAASKMIENFAIRMFPDEVKLFPRW